jgi:hypothetical protein
MARFPKVANASIASRHRSRTEMHKTNNIEEASSDERAEAGFRRQAVMRLSCSGRHKITWEEKHDEYCAKQIRQRYMPDPNVDLAMICSAYSPHPDT